MGSCWGVHSGAESGRPPNRPQAGGRTCDMGPAGPPPKRGAELVLWVWPGRPSGGGRGGGGRGRGGGGEGEFVLWFYESGLPPGGGPNLCYESGRAAHHCPHHCRQNGSGKLPSGVPPSSANKSSGDKQFLATVAQIFVPTTLVPTTWWYRGWWFIDHPGYHQAVGTKVVLGEAAARPEPKHKFGQPFVVPWGAVRPAPKHKFDPALVVHWGGPAGAISQVRPPACGFLSWGAGGLAGPVSQVRGRPGPGSVEKAPGGSSNRKDLVVEQRIRTEK